MIVPSKEVYEEPIQSFVKIERPPYVQLTSMFPLNYSHNPQYDPTHEMTLIRANQNPWTVWSPANLQKEFPVKDSGFLEPVGDTTENRWFVEIGRMRFTFLTSQLLRMEWDENNIFHNDPTIVFAEREKFLKNHEKPSIRVYDKDDTGKIVFIESSHVHIRYGVDGDGKFYVQSPAPLEDTLEITVLDNEGNVLSVWTPGLKDNLNLGGTVRTLDRTSGPVPIEPGLLSRSGWSFVDDTHSPYLLPFDEQPGFDTWTKQRNAPELYSDWYLFAYGRDFKKCLGDFVQVSGNIPLPPKYAFGIWWSRWWRYSDQELKVLVGEFKDNNVPLDNLVIDMDWHLTAYDQMNAGALDRAGQPLGWTGYSWDYELFPNPPEFLDWCHEQGLKTTLNLHPAAGIQPHEYIYPQVAEAMGIDPNTSLHVPFDIAEPKFTRTYFDKVIHQLEEDGIDFWWLDYQQVQITNITHLNPTIWLNHCFFTDMERKDRTNTDESLRGLIFHRWGGLGNHRYQIGFSGDTSSTWEALDFQVFFTTTAANVGFGYWSHDIGGFMSNRPTHPEMYTRWVQWGALSPIFRTHAWRQEFIERRIWKYNSYYFWCMREAIYLRYSLIPYMYTEARRSYDTGVAMLYPVYYDYPMDNRAYAYRTQGMLGSGMMISPITSATSGIDLLSTNNVFIPGTDETWIEWYSLTTMNSGTYIRKVAADENPIYIKEGSIIPMKAMSKDVQNMMHMKQDPLVLSIFPGPNSASGSYSLYEDDGVTVNYKDTSNQAWTFIESNPVFDRRVQWKVSVNPVEGSFRGMVRERSYIVRLVGVPPPTRVIVNGRMIQKQSKAIYSTAPQAFMHWATSRDPSHNFMSPTESSQGWFYDYDHLTLVIRTPNIQRVSTGEITIDWDGLTREEWNNILELLHQGWIGLKSAVSRGFFYWHGAETEQQPTHKLPLTLSQSDVHHWGQVFNDFIAEYAQLVSEMESALDTEPEIKAFRQRVVAHMKHYVR